MDKSVNFKFERNGKVEHCFSLQVVCEKFEWSEKISYCVQALAYGTAVPITISSIYYTSEEAFEFMEQTAKKNPSYNDKRDYKDTLAPEYEEDNECCTDQSEEEMEYD